MSSNDWPYDSCLVVFWHSFFICFLLLQNNKYGETQCSQFPKNYFLIKLKLLIILWSNWKLLQFPPSDSMQKKSWATFLPSYRHDLTSFKASWLWPFCIWDKTWEHTISIQTLIIQERKMGASKKERSHRIQVFSCKGARDWD